MDATAEVKVEVGDKVTYHNDPSDAWDYLIERHGVSPSITLKKEPDFAWSWEDLPFKFGWRKKIISLSKVHILAQPSFTYEEKAANRLTAQSKQIMALQDKINFIRGGHKWSNKGEIINFTIQDDQVRIDFKSYIGDQFVEAESRYLSKEEFEHLYRWMNFLLEPTDLSD